METDSKKAKLQPKPSISDKLQVRYDAITHQLAGRRMTPLSTTELWDQLNGITHGTTRTLQRDLLELERRALVERRDGGWIIGDTFEDQVFDSFAAAIALDVMLTSLDWAIPAEILDQLEKPLRRVRSRLSAAFDDHPRLRWLKALTIMKPYHPLDRPVINPEVREAIERAIQEKTKIDVIFRQRGRRVAEIVSVSDYLIRLPDEPLVQIWPDGAEKAITLPLQDIERAVPLMTPATWPKKSKSLTENVKLSTIEVRASPMMMEYWRGRWIGKNLEVVSVDEGGWSICRFQASTTVSVIRYLIGLGKEVEVRKPYSLRMFIENEVRTATRMYDASAAEASAWCKEEIRATRVGTK